MKQVHLGLFLSLLLAINATGEYNTPDVSSNRFAESQVGVGQADFSGYSAFPGANSFGYYAPQSNIRLPNSGRLMPATSINSFGQLNQQSSDPESSWLPLNNLYTFAQPTASKKRVTAGDLSSSVSNSQGIQRDQTYDYGTNLAPINSNNYRNVRPYAEPTGPPFGIQSTGDILSYTPEKLDLSKCGPLPTANPCTIYGSQYRALPGSPNCYIHCVFGRPQVKPCPADLVWNTRINVCDWSTVAPTTDNDDYTTTLNTNQGFTPTYSYGRKKRSTVERKKRNLAGFGNPSQFLNLYKQGSSPKPGPLRIPLTAYNLPGPVGFSGHVGFAGIPHQYAGSQSVIASLPQPVTPLKPISSPSAQSASSAFSVLPQYQFPAMAPPASSFPQAGTTSDYLVQARSNMPMGNLYADTYASSAIPAQQAAPTASATTSNTVAGIPATVPPLPTADPLLTTATNFQPGLMTASPQLSNFFFPQLSAGLANPFAANNPVSFEATLIPGPYYPYGGPEGGPFGGPMPSPKPKQKRKPTVVDFLNHYRSRGGQTFFPFGAQSSSAPKSFGGFSFPTGNSFGGFSFPNGNSFGGQQLQNLMSLTNQQYPGFTPFANWPYSPFQGFGSQFGGFSPNFKPPATPPFGNSFQLFVPNNDADSSEDEGGCDDSTAQPNKKTDKTTDNKKSDKSNSGSNSNKNKGPKNNRRKRQYETYSSGVSVNEPQQYQNNYNLFRPASYDSTPKTPIASNHLFFPTYSASSPCLHSKPGTNIAYPNDETKFVACLNRFYYVIMSCPSSLVYNAATQRCEKSKNSEAICERERPCLNGGQCYQPTPTTYKCTCADGWSGERCETAVSSCSNNPCGPGNRCLTLHTSDYKQDYVCVCDENKSYGLSCGRNTLPNPCLAETTSAEQYYSFPFSSQAFIQCNGNLLYVRPCAPGLVWSKNEKVCDRIETAPGEVLSQSGTISQGQMNTNDQNSLSGLIAMSRQQTINNPTIERSFWSINSNAPVAQEQPILTNEKSILTPVAPQESGKKHYTKAKYDEVYYERRPRISVTGPQTVESYYYPFQE